MAYELTHSETVAENIKRIAGEELQGAILSLENPGNAPEEAIHDVRKRIKKIRAVFRLIRNELSNKVFKQENIRYRNIGHMMSHVRDATVMINTISRLKEIYPKAIPTAAYNKARQTLIQKQAQASRDFFEEKNAIQQVLNALYEARDKGPDFAFKRNSFAVFSINLKEIYERGIQAYNFALINPSIDSYHELRKEVKNLWYHTRILTPLWPGIFQALARELGTLAELLGDDHDLGVLFGEIESGRLPFSRKATAAKMLSLIHEQRSNLQQQVYPTGKRIFAEKPDDFVGRYRLYWNIWRRENNPNSEQSPKPIPSTYLK